MDIILVSLFSGISFAVSGFNYHYFLYRPKKTLRYLLSGLTVFFLLPIILAVLFKTEIFSLAASCGALATITGLVWLHKTALKVYPYHFATTLIISLVLLMLDFSMVCLWAVG
jgi:hypothetical protein